MDRDELFRTALSCIGAPPESVVIATEERANNLYTFYRDSADVIWYTSARTEAFNAEAQEAIKRFRKAEKRKTSDATRKEASEEPVMLTDHYKESIA